MSDYLNKTSLGFILAFLGIIALSLSLFQVIAHFDEREQGDVPLEAQRAESVSE